MAPTNFPFTPPPLMEDIPLLSDLCEIRQTPSAGRGVFAKTSIPQGTHLHTSISPTVWVISREYRREVCAECFAYNRGVIWKLRDNEHGLGTGVVWCSEDCRQLWMRRYGTQEQEDGNSISVEAMAAVEGLITRAKGWNNGDWDVIMLDSAATKPSSDFIEQAWDVAEETAGLIREARVASLRGQGPKKPRPKVIQRVLAEPPAPDILYFLLSAILSLYRHPEGWTQLLNLSASSTPYASHSRLRQHISAYYQLLAVLPIPLLDCTTAAACLAASNRDTHNSFGLRSLDDGGSEMFGFGVWTSASFWNHSCSPNVAKIRRGRSWAFHASEDIKEGSEICITYLGGDERELDLNQRRKRLVDAWGFVCMCVKCSDESAVTMKE